jgi:hypothetical protein
VTGGGHTPSIDQVRLARLVNDCYDLRLTGSPYLRDGLEALVDEWQRGWADRVAADAHALDMVRHARVLAAAGVDQRPTCARAA